MEHTLAPGGDLERRRGNGGVVTALSAAAARAAGAMPVTWVAAAMTEGDHLVALSGGTPGGGVGPWAAGGSVDARFVTADAEAYRQHYDVFCNPVLWFLQHRLWKELSPARDAQAINRAWRQGYLVLNERFGAAVVAAAAGQRRPAIMLQDYHLYLAAPYVRARLPQARIAHFVHVPWPEPQHWQPLASGIRRALFAGLCANDLVGFQTAADAEHFLRGCAAFLDGAQVDYAASRVVWRHRATHARVYPISIDADGLRRRAVAPDVRALVARLAPLCGEQTILRVDRLDLSKNIVRGFQAFRLLLESRPHLRGRVRFLALLVPSRTSIAEYQSYYDEVMAEANAVNSRFGDEGWQPVQVIYENNYDQAIAAMTLYDVLLVNPVADGMNLVAKEGPIVNERNGVLVLSERAGAYQQLRPGALSIDPHDVPGTAQALATALAMPPEARARRLDLLRQAVDSYGVADWLWHQVDDLMALRPDTPPLVPKMAISGSGSPAHDGHLAALLA